MKRVLSVEVVLCVIMFLKEPRKVYEKQKLRLVYVYPPQPTFLQESSKEEGSATKDSVLDNQIQSVSSVDNVSVKDVLLFGCLVVTIIVLLFSTCNRIWVCYSGICLHVVSYLFIPSFLLLIRNATFNILFFKFSVVTEKASGFKD